MRISKTNSEPPPSLVGSAVLQDLFIISSDHRLLHLRQWYVQPRRFYSTKKNVAISEEEPKILPPKEDSVVSKAKCDRVEELKTDSDKKDLSLDEASSASSSRSDDSASSIITSETSLKEVSKSTIVNNIGDEKLLSKIQRYFLWRFTWYLKRFQQSLENEMPDTFHMFRIFSIGLKDFVVDFK